MTPEQILEPHRQATVERMKEHPVVLIVQDTTELDYTEHPTKDARCLNSEERFGLYQHVQLALTPQRLPLGILSTECFDRPAETLGSRLERKPEPIEEKESFRWLQGYRQARELAAQCPTTRLISVADREADIYDIFLARNRNLAPKPTRHPPGLRGSQHLYAEPRSEPADLSQGS